MFYTGYTAEVDRLSILFSVGLELLRSNLILMFGLVSFFVSPKLPIGNVTLCSLPPGVFMMEQHCSVRELNCIMLVRLAGGLDARMVTLPV